MYNSHSIPKLSFLLSIEYLSTVFSTIIFQPKTPLFPSLVFLTSLVLTPYCHSTTLFIIGDSLTAGFGVSPEESYPKQLETLLRKDFPTLNVVSGGISGATTAGGDSRVLWFKAHKDPTKIFLIALGGNDLLRGIKPEASFQNLKKAILAAKSLKGDVFVAGMKVPLNYGAEYRSRFESIYPKLSRELNVPLLPFLLEGIGGVPALNQSDGIHPNAEGHRRIAEHVAVFLRPYLSKREIKP